MCSVWIYICYKLYSGSICYTVRHCYLYICLHYLFIICTKEHQKMPFENCLLLSKESIQTNYLIMSITSQSKLWVVGKRILLSEVFFAQPLLSHNGNSPVQNHIQITKSKPTVLLIITKQAGAELCQAHIKLGQPASSVSLPFILFL